MKKYLLFLILGVSFLICLSSCGKCEHNFKDATCTQGQSCIMCNETQGEPLGHDWLMANCKSSKTCTRCNATEGEIGTHIWDTQACLSEPVCTVCSLKADKIKHEWIDATCTSPRTCSKCTDTIGIPLKHDFVQTSCLEPRVCSLCNEQTLEGIEHTWVSNGCTEPRTCSVCSLSEEIVVGHKWSESTCTTPMYCLVCLYEQSPAKGHKWENATCTSPKTCSVCEETEGAALGHTWKLTEQIPPSCSNGKDIYSCHCGEEKFTSKPATIYYHVCDENGLCTVCSVQFDVSLMTLSSIVTSQGAYMAKEGVFESPETRSVIFKPITYADIGMPIVELNGDISSISKTNTATINFSYSAENKDFDCLVEIKIQGASSAGYPKKNYSIKLLKEDGSKNKVKLVDEWGKEHKYCMKANWVDYSQARNVVSGIIYGDVIDYRNVEDELTGLVNGGAIDGYPIVVYHNGEFLGLYTMNIPKDKWMFDMKDSDEKNQAIVMGEHWGNSVAMKEPISYNSNNPIWTGSSNWELEYASNEDSLIDNSTLWVAESLNRLINFVINNDGEDFINGISQYADIDKCIDSMIYTFFICADDNVSKNILWVTFDGVHWFSSVYDMDGTWGLKWDGSVAFDENHLLINNLNISNYNLLWIRLYENFYDRIVERYLELRQGPLSYENIEMRFKEFFNKIPDIVRNAEKQKWTGVKSQDTNNLEQILGFAIARIAKMDEILVPKN